jgi:hypothetical protein
VVVVVVVLVVVGMWLLMPGDLTLGLGQCVGISTLQCGCALNLWSRSWLRELQRGSLRHHQWLATCCSPARLVCSCCCGRVLPCLGSGSSSAFPSHGRLSSVGAVRCE